MPKLLRDKRVFVVAVLCGTVISASNYVKQLGPSKDAIMYLLRPISLLSVLNLLPEALLNNLALSPLHLPAWLRPALLFLYWPVLGAAVSLSRHWLLWSVVVLGAHIGFVILIVYELSGGKLSF